MQSNVERFKTRKKEQFYLSD